MRLRQYRWGVPRNVLLLGLLFLGLLLPRMSSAGETDQFMTWDIELTDSADAFNRQLNGSITAYLEKLNGQTPAVDDQEELTRRVYLKIFGGLLKSPLRSWLHDSPEVDRYPEDGTSDWAYQQASILRGFHFPFVLPMAQTVRVGEVYFGIDKIGHFFGFGRRYYQRYLRLLESGMTPEAAERRVIRWGLFHERYTVGGLVDGVFSKGDLEANYQGFRLALALCGGEDPHIQRVGEEWALVRRIDIRTYVTPYFDESYNVPIFTNGRWKTVAPILTEEICPRSEAGPVTARFARYAAWKPSLAQEMMVDYVAEEYPRLSAEQDLEVLCHGK